MSVLAKLTPTCFSNTLRIFRANDFLDAIKQATEQSRDWKFDHLDIVLGHWVYYFLYKGRKFGGGKLRIVLFHSK